MATLGNYRDTATAILAEQENEHSFQTLQSFIESPELWTHQYDNDPQPKLIHPTIKDCLKK